MKPYCTVKDIAKAVPMDALLAAAKGDARETDALAYARIEQGIERASTEIDKIINNNYSNMLDIMPSAARDGCAYLAAYYTAHRGRPHYSAPSCLRYSPACILEALRKLAEHPIIVEPKGEIEND